jgi:hypothetical protein
MRKLLIIFVLIWSCSTSVRKAEVETISDTISTSPQFDSDNVTDSHAVDTISIKQSSDSIGKELSVPQISALPFGCSLIISHRFPKEWEVDPYDSFFLPHEKEYNDMVKCFGELNSAHSVRRPPVVSIEYIKIGDYDTLKFDDALMRSIDNCKYRLSDFGRYECYYVYNNNDKPWGSGPFCASAGNLILYNPDTKRAKVINLYFRLLMGDGYSRRRFFYIHENKSVQIFEGFSMELSNGLESKYIVNILPDGQIDVDEN